MILVIGLLWGVLHCNIGKPVSGKYITPSLIEVVLWCSTRVFQGFSTWHAFLLQVAMRNGKTAAYGDCTVMENCGVPSTKRGINPNEIALWRGRSAWATVVGRHRSRCTRGVCVMRRPHESHIKYMCVRALYWIICWPWFPVKQQLALICFSFMAIGHWHGQPVRPESSAHLIYSSGQRSPA